MLDVENVIMSAECGRPFDVESLVAYGPALKDLKFPAAKYCFEIPAASGRKQAVVSVFASGKVICTGANTVRRARACLGKVLGMLRVGGEPDVVLQQVVMSGTIMPRLDVYRAVERLRARSFHVQFDSEVLHAVIIRGRGAYTQVHADADPVSVVSRGRDEETVTGAVGEIYREVCAANGRGGA